MMRAVFLDRDGVINAYVHHAELGIVDSPANCAEFELMPGVSAAIAQFNRLGFRVVVISNQPGLAKRKFSVTQLHAVTSKMKRMVLAGGGRIDNVYYCLHHPESLLPRYRMVCDCRKPRPGLLLEAARVESLDLTRSYMIGDGVMDVQAGAVAGCATVFVSARKCYVCEELARRDVRPDYIVNSLAEAATLITALENGQTKMASRYCFGGPCGQREEI